MQSGNENYERYILTNYASWTKLEADCGIPRRVHSERESQLICASESVGAPDYNYDLISSSSISHRASTINHFRVLHDKDQFTKNKSFISTIRSAFILSSPYNQSNDQSRSYRHYIRFFTILQNKYYIDKLVPKSLILLIWSSSISLK